MRNISRLILGVISFLLIAVIMVTTSGQAVVDINPDLPKYKNQTINDISSMSLAFTENRGQWDEQVLFRANAGGATMWFTRDGATYEFSRNIQEDTDKHEDIISLEGQQISGNIGSAQNSISHPENSESISIKASFVGANRHPQMVGVEIMEYRSNYFIGNDPKKWHTDVPNYAAIVYKDIYAGIDLKYYGNGTEMEYDFIVSPGADASQILVQYDGAKSINVSQNGELVIETNWGKVVERKPYVYQLVNNNRELVECEYTLIDNNVFSFNLPRSYDTELALVIDPVLSYSTYLGKSDGEQGKGITVDPSGNIYVTGFTASTDFPVEGEYQTDQPEADAFVTKLNSTGDALIYSTYLGGNNDEEGISIEVDGFGNVYVVGQTYSTDFPTTWAYQTDQGAQDLFVTKINSSGNGLIYSTYLGGSDIDIGYDIAINGSGNAYVTGYTLSTNFPTQGAYQTDQGSMDAFVTKLNTVGNGLVYSTYLGGSSSERGHGITIDGSGNAYVVGWTVSADFPIEGEYQTYQGGDDAFVTKLNSVGNGLIYSTFLGGSGSDAGQCIAIDGLGDLYIAGQTSSTDFPSAGAYQTHHGNLDAFVTKLSGTSYVLIYSTFLGGSGTDYCRGMAIDSFGNAYVTGFTMSNDFPVKNSIQTYQSSFDIYVSKLNSFGNDIIYSTYLGGNNNENNFDLAVDGSGNAYTIGYTNSSNFPTEEAYQATYGGSGDAFISKLSLICVDTDGDGFGDPGHSTNECPIDNCPDNYNPGQEDTNGNDVGDACDFVCGDLNDDTNIDILDIVFLINYKYKGGTAPDPLESADVNHDTNIDILDIVHLINFKYKGGAAPDCP
ncbi:MAG: hypothetical protein GY855_05730 [candidate division Zixibacteria bacterium]|nr:hypothetical protein [candidate division Zixibacteria bacterium]